jgi:hypothetical protein
VPTGRLGTGVGSQVWNGHSGALMAKAMKKPLNSAICTGVLISSWVSASNAKVPSPWSAETTYSPMTAASMSSPPARL